MLKRSLLQVSAFLLIIFNLTFTFAQGCSLGTDDAPQPSAIACVLGRIINIATFVAGSAFVAMVGYGAVKLGLATGSPEGYKGAKATWQWAVIGVFIIMGVYMILSVVSKLFGFNVSPGDMVSALGTGINNLFELAIHGEGN